MPVIVLEVDAVEQEMLNGWVIYETTNGQNTLSCRILSADGTYRPVRDQAVSITKGAVLWFGGRIKTPHEQGILDEGGTPIVTNVTAGDNNVLFNYRVINLELPAGTLKEALVALLAQSGLADYGMTLDPAQVDGPDLSALSFPFMYASTAFQLLSKITKFVYENGYDNVLRMFDPASTPAPFDVTEDNLIGDVQVEPALEDHANRVLVLGGQGEQEVVEAFTGDGVETEFELNYTLSAHRGVVTNGSNNEPIGVTAPPYWTYETVGGVTTFTRSSPPANLNAIVFTYTAHFPKLVTAMADPPPDLDELKELLLVYPDEFNYQVLQAYADTEVLRQSPTLKRVRYSTFEWGVHPGMTQTITYPKRNVSGLHLITDVVIRHIEGNIIKSEVTAVQGAVYPGSWRDMIASWGKGSSFSGGGSGGSGTAVVVTSRPSYFLGGGLSEYVQSPTPTWVPATAVRVVLDTVARGTETAVVTARLRAVSGNVTARLRNVTDNVTAGTSVVVTSTSWVDVVFVASLTPGSRSYELQVLPSVANIDVAAVGYLE